MKAKIRVVLDTNVYVSFLLGSPLAERLLEAAAKGKYTLLYTRLVFEEIAAVVARKPYLYQHISPTAVGRLITFLEWIGKETARPEIIPAIVRDPKDDYILACAVMEQADYLVTGDKDLLVLKEVKKVLIITPRMFAELLELI